MIFKVKKNCDILEILTLRNRICIIQCNEILSTHFFLKYIFSQNMCQVFYILS